MTSGWWAGPITLIPALWVLRLFPSDRALGWKQLETYQAARRVPACVSQLGGRAVGQERLGGWREQKRTVGGALGWKPVESDAPAGGIQCKRARYAGSPRAG